MKRAVLFAVLAASLAVAAVWAQGERFVPGTKKTQAKGHSGLVYVSVYFTSMRMVSIIVTSHTESTPSANMVFNRMIPAMLDSQTYHVDTVAGATATSEALRLAVQQAMTQARRY